MLLIALALAAIDPPPRPMAVEVVADPITDKVSASATLRDRGERLVVACDPSDYEGVRVRLHATRWLARGNLFSGERPLIYRFDDQPPRRRLWSLRDRHATLSGQSRVRPFLRALVGAGRLVFRTRDIEDRRIDIAFRIEGAAPAVARLLEACGERPLSDDPAPKRSK